MKRNLLSEVSHRPYELPAGKWKYYQEWNNALFLHWEVPFEGLRSHVPKNLNIDTFEGKSYISLVAFTMQKIRPRSVPSIKLFSDFHEINLRTYVEHNGKQGVYFLNIEAEKYLSVFFSRLLSGLPYEKAIIKREGTRYNSINQRKDFFLDAEFEIGDKIPKKTGLDKWLTERYCLYMERDGVLYRYDVHHREWEIQSVQVRQLKLKYQVGEIDLSDRMPDILHYSPGVKVIAWSKQSLPRSREAPAS